ncbi:serine rich and transmembrane domain containing 1 [Rhincodon typus]|uniref:serine rich and transmembrane domain containing 1 n=1 Tax=Rhincodon typus TaxID=259920 RepID=UPI0009A2AFA9|nr:serine rich and transmembrane domain containing 1 [Rhincodon typus]
MATVEKATDSLSENSGNLTIDESYPTSINDDMDSSSTIHLPNIFVYLSIFLSLLAFLILFLVIALQKLKNVTAFSSSCHEDTSNTGSSETNLEICSLSSRSSGFSALSS